MENHTFTRIYSLSTTLLSSVVAFVILLACATVAQAQDDDQEIMPARGFHPTHGYALGDIETISTTSGNLMLNIPLASLPPGRGGHPGFKLSLQYNSKVWDGEADVAQNPLNPQQTVNVVWLQESQEGGWHYNIPQNFYFHVDNRNSHGVFFPPPDIRNTHIFKLKMMFPDGSAREMRPYGFDDGANDGYFAVQPASGMSYYSTDGSYLRLDIGANGAWTLSFPDGGKVINSSPGVQRTVDRHGAYIERTLVSNYNNTGHEADVITDQLGRTIVIEHGTDEDYIRVAGVGGVEVVTTVKWTRTWVSKVYRAGNHFQFDANLNRGLKAVSEIDLPVQLGAGLKYLFAYNGNTASGGGTSVGWGELSSVTLPAGANVTYQYEMDNKSGPGWQANMVLANSPTRKNINYTLEYDNTTAAAPTEVWHYSIGEGAAAITGPDGGITQEFFMPAPTLGRVYKTRRPDGSIIERIWKENRPFLPAGVTIFSGAVVNPFVETEFLSVPDAIGNLILTSIKHYSYDKNGNVTQVKDYDWVPYSSITRDGFGKPTGVPGGLIPKRINNTAYHCETPNSSDGSFDPDVYQHTTAPAMRNAAKVSQLGNNTQMLTRTEFSYDDPFTTGNLTAQRSWDSIKGPINGTAPLLDDDNSIVTTTSYDNFGNPTVTIDARQVQTQYTYGPVNGVSNLYPTEIKTAAGTPVQRWEKREYDFNTALVTRVIDWDNSVSSLTQYDALGRTTLVRTAENKPEQTEIATQYFAAERHIVVRSDQEATGDGKLVTVQHFDQLGRVRLTRTLEEFTTAALTNELAGIKTQTRYEVFNPCAPTNSAQCLADNAATIGTYVVTSNPFRAATSDAATSETTMGWKRARRDRTGRPVETRTFSGTTLPAPWGNSTASTGAVTSAYEGNLTTITDQAGKLLRRQVNGIGQLVRLDEPSDAANTLGNQATLYDYDALGNLKLVTQGGQTRNFVYSSLSRLTSSFNPESGTTNYEYDANGNVTKKIDPRLVPNTSTNRTTIIGYDLLGRVTSRTYNDGTPNVTFTYDDPNTDFSRGRMTAMSSSASTYLYDEYDSIGRAKTGTQIIDGQSYTMHYDYNFTGAMVSQTYPSGKIVKTEYDGAGRVAGVQNLSNAHYYVGAGPIDANRVQYSPSGSVVSMKLGNNLWESTTFNSRLQPTKITLGTSTADASKLRLDYTYGVIENSVLDTTKNNGNVESQTLILPGLNLKQTYTYDELNRLKSAIEKNGTTDVWKQTYKYDRFGNRRFDKDNTTLPAIPTESDPATNPTISEANNRISAAGYRYDNAGNLECDPNHPCSGSTAYYEYDADNKLKTALGGATNGGSNYLYDGEGRRVKKITGGVNGSTTVFVYNVSGQMIAEYSSAAPQPSGTISYITADYLGTPRVITQPNQNVSGRHDYQPFGEEIAASFARPTSGYADATDKVRQKFTSKERDSETGLDYFDARYYASAQGRFTSADPLMQSAKTGDPQTWNRFVYVLNNPLRYVDPDGLETASAWSQLTEEEQQIIGPKLDRQQIPAGGSQTRLERPEEAFNRIFTGSNAQETQAMVVAVKNLIDATGGHTNSEVWQNIGVIDSARVTDNNSAAIAFRVDDSKKFLAALSKSGFEVDAFYENAKYFTKEGPHRHSARFTTDTSHQPGLHIIQDHHHERNRFDSHFDARSSSFRQTDDAYWTRETEQRDAGRSHYHPYSSVEMRQKLRDMGIVPKNEP